jgi:hypothetical protein
MTSALPSPTAVMSTTSPLPSPAAFQGNRPHSLSSLADDTHEDHPSMLNATHSNPSLYAGPTLTSKEVLSLSKSRKITVNTRQEMSYSDAKMVGTMRVTGSDVMSICNTVRPVGNVDANLADPAVYSKSKVRAKFPSSYSKPGKPMATIFTKQANQTTQKIKNAELHEERRVFLLQLNASRDERSALENSSATTVQKTFRGFRSRPKSYYYSELKTDRAAKRLVRNGKVRLIHDLVELSDMLSLPPIPGMTLNSAAALQRQERDDKLREEVERENAVVELQSLMRQRLDKKRVEQLRREANAKRQTQAATRIQSYERGIQGRVIHKKKQAAREYRAITLIQSRIRSQRSRHFCVKLKQDKAYISRRNGAATGIQAIYRGKLSRRKYGYTRGFSGVWRKRQQSMYEKSDKIAALKGLKLTEQRRPSLEKQLKPLQKMANESKRELLEEMGNESSSRGLM